MTRIAFLGTGLMGLPMAEHLIAVAPDLRVWNRTAEKAKPLTALGATLSSSPAEAAQDADVVILMLYTSELVSQALFEWGIAGAMSRGGVVISMTTMTPSAAREHARGLAEYGIAHIDAPVSGGTRGAADASLAIMAGGDRSDFDRVFDILKSMGRPTYVGPAGAGQVAKCVNQIIVAITIGAVSEGLVLASAGGADPGAVREALIGGFADSRILREHGERMVTRNFQPGGPSRSQVKDLNIILSVAGELGLNLPLTEHVRELYESLVEYASELDHSALFLEIERINERVLTGTASTSTERSGSIERS